MRKRGLGAVAVVLAALIPLVPVMLKGEVPSFRDHEDYFLPLRAYTAEALRDFDLPLWNPYNASGEPWLANPQTGVFYPPAWIVAALPFEVGYVAFLVFHLAVLGLGLRYLFRIRSSDAAATFASIALVVSGPMLSLLDVSNNLATFAWTPWLLARALKREAEPGVVDSVLLALSFLGGEPLLAVLTWLAWAGLTLARLGRGGVSPVAWRLFMAVGIAAAQLFPFAALLVGSDRASGLSPDVAFRNSLAIGDWLATIVSPAGIQPGIGRSQVFLPSLYLCPLIPFLALGAFTRDVPRRWRLGWIAVLIGSVVLASGSQFPLVGRLFEAVMLTVNRYPVKFALFGFVAVGALCAVGFDRLGELSARERITFACCAAVLMIVAQLLHRSAYAPIAATGIIVGLFWLGGYIALLGFGGRLGTESRALLVWVLLPVVVFESLAASRFLLSSTPWPVPAPYADVLDERFSVIRLEQLDAVRTGDAHVRDRSAWMGGYLNLLSRQHDASTAAPVVDRRYQSLHDVALSGPRHDVLDFLSVRYILTERDLSSFGYPAVASHAGVAVFERPTAKSMVSVDFTPREARDDKEAFDEVMKPGPDAGIGASSISVNLANEYPSEPPTDGAAKLAGVSWSRDSVRMTVEVTHPALLVLNQRMRPGWSVTVDGMSRPTVTVNALFRGVELDRGVHEVVWLYRPRSLRAGIFVSLAAMCALAFELKRVRDIRKKMSRSFHSEHA